MAAGGYVTARSSARSSVGQNRDYKTTSTEIVSSEKANSKKSGQRWGWRTPRSTHGSGGILSIMTSGYAQPKQQSAGHYAPDLGFEESDLSRQQPERELLRRLLYRAVLDLGSQDLEFKSSAIRFFAQAPDLELDNPDKALGFSFRFCCEELELEPKPILERLRAAGLLPADAILRASEMCANDRRPTLRDSKIRRGIFPHRRVVRPLAFQQGELFARRTA